MEDPKPLDHQCDEAIRILDSALGMRACGIVVSGSGTPRFSCEESPFQLTMRSLVAPVMLILGTRTPVTIPRAPGALRAPLWPWCR